MNKKLGGGARVSEVREFALKGLTRRLSIIGVPLETVYI